MIAGEKDLVPDKRSCSHFAPYGRPHRRAQHRAAPFCGQRTDHGMIPGAFTLMAGRFPRATRAAGRPSDAIESARSIARARRSAMEVTTPAAGRARYSR